MRPSMEYRNVTRDGDSVRGESRYLDGTAGWHSFSANWKLARIYEASDDPVAALRIWGLQDGFGEAGFVPPQGWDWSGIRDSSPGAVAMMDAVASEFVSDGDLEAMYGLAGVAS